MIHTLINIKKSILGIATVATVLAFGFTACDEVDENERFVEMPARESKRNVLVEEFTGQQCTNCPDAHKALATLSEQYGSNLIVVGIHAGSFGMLEGANSKYVGLKQPEGDEYANRWGDLDVLGYPIAGFDRKGQPATLISGTWDTTIYEEMQRPTNLDINLTAHINAANEIEISAELKPYADMKGKLQLWVVEDSIVAVQVDHGKIKKDYVHNHVYRAAVNGTWGEDVALLPEINETKTASIAVKDNWNANHLHIVAFVYNDKDGVLQAQKAEVIK